MEWPGPLPRFLRFKCKCYGIALFLFLKFWPQRIVKSPLSLPLEGCVWPCCQGIADYNCRKIIAIYDKNHTGGNFLDNIYC